MINILIIEDDENKLKSILHVVNCKADKEPNYETVDNVQSALEKIRLYQYDIIILDLNLPLRKGENARENGGSSILYRLNSPEYCTPKYLIALTQYTNLAEKYGHDFSRNDINIYNYNDDNWHEVLVNKIKWVAQNNNHKARDSENEIYILTHGIMTSGYWQDTLTDKLANLGASCISYKYTYYSLFKILFSLTRKKAVIDYQNFIKKIIIENPRAKINFISHSFGSYLTMEALKEINYDFKINIGYIILCGSVVKNSYDVVDIVNRYNPNRIVNECGYQDTPLVICNLLCLGLGHAGRVGFHGYNEKITNRFHKGGHSYFFEQDDFYEKFWEPLLIKNVITNSEKVNKSSARDLFESLIEVISPLTKLIPSFVFLGSVILLITYIIPKIMASIIKFI
ncbi:response regulator [Serratia quinivorans]|uniref:response regulator n=1 Tax=Serratia quinivorans TaxID=137545 RepID=UPI002177319D|nr:response regulator [Serratia quinivorans]CAI1074197.1 Uncharacterised protein [Serratia quinivorans]CAI1752253.1 Uncharacterised protein [Serratia quinivorans]